MFAKFWSILNHFVASCTLNEYNILGQRQEALVRNMISFLK